MQKKRKKYQGLGESTEDSKKAKTLMRNFTRSNCNEYFRSWSTSQVFHVLESPLLACIAPAVQEIDCCNCTGSDLG